jgi:hypothetical protein
VVIARINKNARTMVVIGFFSIDNCTGVKGPLVGLHHYLMLFLMLAFSFLFNYDKFPGLRLGASYMFTMVVGRLLRVMTCVSTILPSA